MAVSHDDVRRIAALARIAVPAERLDEIARELNGILEHMGALANVAGVEAHRTAEEATPGMRLERDAGPSVAMSVRPELFAPRMRDGFFLVPRLSTHEDTGES